MISRITLQNFKCFRDQTLDVGPLTLLSGLNGSGKSTALQSLLLLRQSHEQGLLLSSGLALNGDLVQMGTGIDLLYQNATDDVVGIDVEWSSDQRASWLFDYNREADVLRGSSTAIDPGVFDTSLFSSRFEYLQAERIGPRTFFEMSEHLVRQKRRLGSRGEFASHFLSLFGEEQVSNRMLWNDRAASASLRAQVEAWLGEIAPGIRLHITPHANMDLVNLEYSDGQLSNHFRSTSVGFGLTYTLPILVALLSAGEDTLLLIENPEAHLHPHGQARIGELLASAVNGGVQVVVETHSDHVLNGIRVSVHEGRLDPAAVQLHFFTRGEQDGTFGTSVASPMIDRRGRIDFWPTGFFDEWDRSLEALLGPGAE